MRTDSVINALWWTGRLASPPGASHVLVFALHRPFAPTLATTIAHNRPFEMLYAEHRLLEAALAALRTMLCALSPTVLKTYNLRCTLAVHSK